MSRMPAVEAAVRVMEREGIHQTFGVPGAAINPIYAAMKRRGTMQHVLARHVEGASHMAEGYTRASAGSRTVTAHLVTGLAIDSMSTAWKSSL